MELVIDRAANMGYIYLRERGSSGAVMTSVPLVLEAQRAEFVMDFDEDGHLVGIEVLSPLQLLLPAEVASASPAGG